VDPGVVPSGPVEVGERKVIGYYPAWGTYARNYQVADIPGEKVSHINYAFANISGGKCVLGDSYADIDKAFAGDTWDTGVLRGNFNQLIKLREQNPHLQTLISLGGWTWSSNFSDVAATPESRKAFVDSCVDFMEQYKFDGIDVDWEYPVGGGLYPGKPEDKTNYTLLMQELRVGSPRRNSCWEFRSTVAGGTPTAPPQQDCSNRARAPRWAPGRPHRLTTPIW
jgi:chitinase